MAADMSRVLIEAVVEQTLEDFPQFPERSVRRLMDLFLRLAEGRAQYEIFAAAHRFLADRQSGFYGLIRGAAADVDRKRLAAFGVNLGYESLLAGADTIRRAEAREGCFIPWTISLAIDASTLPQREAAYGALIDQGRQLGVHTWLLLPAGGARALLPLAAAYPDCAFLLFCDAEEITEAFLDEAGAVPHLMPVIRYGDSAAGACAALRQRRLLFSTYLRYREADLERLAGGDLFCCAEILHPAVTFFLADDSCPEAVRQAARGHILEARRQQQYRTILWDVDSDGAYVSRAISGAPCSAAFAPDGTLHTGPGHPASPETLFQTPLATLLRKALPQCSAI